MTTSTSTPLAPSTARAAVIPDRDRVVTTIDPDVEIHGRIVVRSDKCMLIEGTVNGEIVSAGTVIVGEGAAVRGAVSARNLIVSGHVECPESRIEVRGLLAMKRGGTISAQTIAYGDLEHERGARLSGELDPLDLPCEEGETAPTSAAIVPVLAARTSVGRPPADSHAVATGAAGAADGSAEVRVEGAGAGPSDQPPLRPLGVRELDNVSFTPFKPLQAAAGT
jgi:cytoskeletal protein CcmA (bactofilin family)